MDVEITSMCAVIDADRVLMIKREKSWKGWAFPGGHLENDESMEACVRREIKEETGIYLDELEFKGIAHIYNPETKKRHMIFSYLSHSYHGEVNELCDEGKIEWVPIVAVKEKQLSEGMEYRIPIFLEKGVHELYIEWNELQGYTKVEYYNL